MYLNNFKTTTQDLPRRQQYNKRLIYPSGHCLSKIEPWRTCAIIVSAIMVCSLLSCVTWKYCAIRWEYTFSGGTIDADAKAVWFQSDLKSWGSKIISQPKGFIPRNNSIIDRVSLLVQNSPPLRRWQYLQYGDVIKLILLSVNV